MVKNVIIIKSDFVKAYLWIEATVPTEQHSTITFENKTLIKKMLHPFTLVNGIVVLYVRHIYLVIDVELRSHQDEAKSVHERLIRKLMGVGRGGRRGGGGGQPILLQ